MVYVLGGMFVLAALAGWSACRVAGQADEQLRRMGRWASKVEARRVGPYRVITENGLILRVLREGCLEAGEEEWVRADVVGELCDAMDLCGGPDAGMELIELDRACRTCMGYQSPIALYRLLRGALGHQAALNMAREKARQAWRR